ncbi:low affinity immunoglobulin gamma Fc region receptor II-like [Trachinotus anak]|uniref:low affinity immunoglobulin gamma Fc region receptor II-like n=1 Tax=Trachinotus anak TaxID=443729 RepID=UPI0039F1F8B5
MFSSVFSNKVTVTLQPNWPLIYRGEKITVRCEIQGGGDTEWTYEWRTPSSHTPPSHSEYRISSVTLSHSGSYWCRGRKDLFSSTEWSDVIRLTVSSDKPRASLTADTTVIPAGGRVTLTCSVDPSSGWKYDWYRDNKLSEPLNTHDADFHTTGQISVSQGGVYSCRGGRGDPVYYTEKSQEVRIDAIGDSSFPVWLIVGLVCGIVLIVLLLLLYRCRQSMGDISLDAEDAENGEPQDVTYSSIELKNIGKKHKHREPAETSAYSDIKKRPADNRPLYAQVNINTKEKAKKKKGKSAPAATDDSVYSEVKNPGTAFGL